MTRGGLSRIEAADFVGVAPSTFDELVKSGVMPPRRTFPGCNRFIWLREELEIALRNLPVDGRAAKADDESAGGWDGVRA